MPYYIYLISVFLSAFLLFQIQPMIGKFLLPWYGGTPTVWSTILLFSQVLLTGGYAYAYWILGRNRTRLQGIIHLVLLIISLGLLLYTTLSWPSPLTPDASWRPQDSELPVLGILRVLVVAIGVPFLLLSSTSTLMQGWFHRDMPQRSPYRLYSLSNTGSLLALLTYPIVFEPNLTLKTQSFLWAAGYVVFVLLAGFLSWRTYQWTQPLEPEKGKKKVSTETAQRPAARIYVLWIALAATASTLLIATTSQITQEIAVVPFLWVLPLVIYLLTFILAFAGGKLYWRWIYLGIFVFIILFTRMLLSVPTADIILQVLVISLLLFVSCMMMHTELYKLRPDAQYLSSFYLMVALGGAVGGIFVNLIAPLIFSTGFWELQLGLIAVVVLMAILVQREYRPRSGKRRKKGQQAEPFWRKIKPVVLALLALVVLQTTFVVYYAREIAAESELALRNFYGVLRVWELDIGRPELLANQLTHGRTAHGFQFVSDDLRALPTAYFTPTSGVGLTILNHTQRPQPLRIGALGLGIGIVSTYGEANDVYRFYEVNPDVIRIAEGEGGYFSYLEDSNATIEVVEGDARVSLEKELLEGGSQEYDLLILDVFSGDTMPLHLLTREAFEVYLEHLKEDGIIAINISNRLFNLYYPIYMLADEFGLQTARIETPGDAIQSYDSAWMMLTRNTTFLERPPIQSRSLERPSIPDNLRLWTDDFSNLFQILK